MSAEAAALVRTVKVGRYQVTFTCPHPGIGALLICAEWEPHVPERLTRKERREYRHGRDAVLREYLVMLREAQRPN